MATKKRVTATERMAIASTRYIRKFGDSIYTGLRLPDNGDHRSVNPMQLKILARRVQLAMLPMNQRRLQPVRIRSNG